MATPETIAAAVAALDGGDYAGEVGAADYQLVRDAAVDACVTDTVLAAIGELFGPSHPFERRHAVDMPRPYEPHKAWTHQTVHVDDDYPTLMPAGWALGMFIFLTPVTPHGGAFLYAPGSPYRYRALLADNPEWPLFYTAHPEAAGPAQEFLAQPGDVLLFHHLLAHAGSSNVSDPRTRHALLARWHPLARIVPGDKPFAEMSTIERANSTRYLHNRSEAGTLAGVLAEATTEVLRDGLSLPGGIAAHAVIRYEGVTHLFYTPADGAAILRHVHSHDWATWEQGAPVEGVQGPAHALSLFREGEQILLFVGTGGPAPHTHVVSSPNLRTWTPLATLEGVVAAAGHSTTDYGSERARGKVVLAVLAAAPRVVAVRWGRAWEGAAGWAEAAQAATEAAQAATAPADATVLDAFVKPVLGESELALVVDLQMEGDGRPRGGETRPWYARSGDSADYGGALRPLAFTAPAPPRTLRVYARARNYWLVTYQRRQSGQEGLFWGAIDWEREEPVLEEISSTTALLQALAVVGIS